MSWWRTPTAAKLRPYGLTVAGWLRLMDDCGGKCVLCEKPFTRKRVPATDHNHYNGRVRGLPCVPCNERLGWLHEDVRWLENAADYLKNPPAYRLGLVAKAPNSPPEE